MATRARKDWLWLAAIGLIAGYLSGLFGVGGGILVVPALMGLVGFSQRHAAGTSLAAIAPTAIVGVAGYAAGGHVDLIAAALLAVGSIAGAQLGSLLLDRLPRPVLHWAFIAFIAVVIASLFFVVPSRGAEIAIAPLSVVGLLVLGLVTGILSGLLGIGGGVVIVPMLMLLFGASDLVAKGTSLLMMIPTAVSGTIGNARRRNVDLPAALVVGLAACLSTGFGVLSAGAIEPQLANILFAAFLALIALRMILQGLRRRSA